MVMTRIIIGVFIFSTISFWDSNLTLEKEVKISPIFLSQNEISILSDKIRKNQTCLKNEEFKFCQYLNQKKYSKNLSKKKKLFFSRWNIKKLQKESWEDLMPLVLNKNEQYWLKQEKYITKTKSCPRNLSAMIIKKLYDNISNKDIYSSLKNYYSHLSSCPSMVSHDDQHIRMAIIFYNKKDFTQAKKAIKKALESYKSKNFSRVNYWAGVILEDNTFFHKIIKKSPFSFHSVLASKKIGINLFDNFSELPLSRRKPLDLFSLYVSKLIEFGHEKEAYKIINQRMKYLDPLKINHYVDLFLENNSINWANFLITRATHSFSYSLPKSLILKGYPLMYKDFMKNYNSDPILIHSLIKQESGFDSQAVSSAKAFGLMQVIKPTAASVDPLKAKDLLNPENNLHIGITYYEELKKEFGSDELALAAYNAGPHRVRKWIKNNQIKDPVSFIDLIPFDETRIYVGSIFRNKYFYEIMEKENSSLKSKLLEFIGY